MSSEEQPSTVEESDRRCDPRVVKGLSLGQAGESVDHREEATKDREQPAEYPPKDVLLEEAHLAESSSMKDFLEA